jgi:hypothetical protein
MIKNLINYFDPVQEIFLDAVNYNKANTQSEKINTEFTLLCHDNIKVDLYDEGVRIIIMRTLTFEPDEVFNLSVSFGAYLKFNAKKSEHEWSSINLAEEFRSNGDFVTAQLMNRITLLIGQITSSFGQNPIITPPTLAKKI